MKKQGMAARMDESLGMRDGKESGKMQSYKDRRDESRGASKGMKNLKDNMQAYEVYGVNSNCEKEGQKIKPFNQVMEN